MKESHKFSLTYQSCFIIVQRNSDSFLSVPVLRAAYDNALKEVDILIMPTTPMKAMPIPNNPTVGEFYGTALGMIQNTCPFDCTHHPAMNVPCAKSDGLPVGMMLIGRHFEDDVVLRAGHAFEKMGIYT